ncbi:MAG: hypothetical protein JSW06_02680 [Thermoplasmatales archaeon]|nr:MAG: hypothetical protein JSW06_02680 [Thermoplasmatales archaeon]
MIPSKKAVQAEQRRKTEMFFDLLKEKIEGCEKRIEELEKTVEELKNQNVEIKKLEEVNEQ